MDESSFTLLREQLLILRDDLHDFRNELGAVRQKVQEIEIHIAVMRKPDQSGVSGTIYKWTITAILGLITGVVALFADKIK